MRIILKSLSLLNFKGVRSLPIVLDQVTNIYGDNGTGKTTIFDAFLWLLFGKDSTDRKDFEIKTLDKFNKPYQKMEHEVTGVFEVDGDELAIRRIYKEKWVTKKGSSIPEFSGHETTYFWNDVPVKMEEFQAKISGLMNESVFKLITNTAYFNAMKWQDRRNELMRMAGNIPVQDVLDKIMTIDNKDQFTGLINALNAKKTLDEYRRELAAKKKRINDEKVSIPAKIEECKRLLPEAKDYQALQLQLDSLKESLVSIDGQLMSKSQAQTEYQKKITRLINKKSELGREQTTIEFRIKNSVRDAKSAREQAILDAKRLRRTAQDNKVRNDNDIVITERDITAIKKQQDTLRSEYIAINAEKLEFKDGEFCCPACLQEFKEEDITNKKEELTQNFNRDKSKRLGDNQSKGKALGERIKELDAKLLSFKNKDTEFVAAINKYNIDIPLLEDNHTTLSLNEQQQVDSELASDTRCREIAAEIILLDVEIETPVEEDDKTALLQQKRDVNTGIDQLNTALSTKEQRTKTLKRILELEGLEQSMAQELATLEASEFAIEQFSKAEMETLVDRINGKFSIVTFKMFEDQINGGQTPTCQTLIDGVPYSDANTASKINAGLDIIAALSRHYNVWAPIFIDNRESVIRIPESDSQIINLIVLAGSELSVGKPKPRKSLTTEKETGTLQLTFGE